MGYEEVMADESSRRINASPTKEFFIHMLTRDVQLSRSILDLVDNSVDGAHRLRATGPFNGLWVRIEIGKDAFSISDNCGGISVDIARNYAFRFGRPPKAKDTPGSVGLFGVGMKRTFFKLGREFLVKSRCKSEGFTLNVDVDQWLQEVDDSTPGEWHFEFSTVDEAMPEVNVDDTGTIIQVKRLLPAVSDSFSLNTFISQLVNELGSAHSTSLDRGLSLTVNMIPVNFSPQKLFRSDHLVPAFVERSYPRVQIDGVEGESLKVRLYAGIAERSYHAGGWYIFCNGRLILEADKTPVTIWGAPNEMRQYHADFAFFRGFAYIDSAQSSLLPWTTTKTGVDTDSPVYKIIQREMIEISKPVLTFLSDLAKQKESENQGDIIDEIAKNAIATAVAIRTDAVTTIQPFIAPRLNPVQVGPRYQRIQYSKPLDEVKKAMQKLKVNSFKEVGERTFDYYLEYEGD